MIPLEDVGFPLQWKVVAYHKNRRKHLEFGTKLKKASKAYAKLKKAGVPCVLVCKNHAFPPKGRARVAGQWWCPYCRIWDFFVIPRNDAVYTPIGVRVHLWCGISEQDFDVREANEGLGRKRMSPVSSTNIRRRARRLTRRR